jgi:hypothetical protein
MFVFTYCEYALKEFLLAQEICLYTPVFCSVWEGLYEGSLLLAMLRTIIHARGISDITIGQKRNVCYCQLELGVVGRWNNRLPLAIAETSVSVSGVRLIPYWPQEEHV